MLQINDILLQMFEDFLAQDLNTRVSFVALIVLCVMTFIGRSKARALKKRPLEAMTTIQKAIWALSFVVICLSVFGIFE
jgi:hypothetical protein